VVDEGFEEAGGSRQHICFSLNEKG
jgi:hypothetical protein